MLKILASRKHKIILSIIIASILLVVSAEITYLALFGPPDKGNGPTKRINPLV